MNEQLSCPKCKTPASASDIHCKNCRFNLRDVKTAEQTMLVPYQTQDVMQAPPRRAYFPKNAHLGLFIEQAEKTITIAFNADSHFVLGRGIAELDIVRIDLAPFGAAKYGVSRRHARLIRMPAILIVEDLGTLNGTYINGERLGSGHAYVLCEGDSLKLGGMTLKVSFEVKE